MSNLVTLELGSPKWIGNARQQATCTVGATASPTDSKVSVPFFSGAVRSFGFRVSPPSARLPTAVSLVFGGQTIAVATEFEPVAGEVGAYTIRFFEEPAPPLPLNLLVYHEIELCFDGLDGPAKCAHVTTTAVMESAVEGTGTQVQFPPSGDAYQSVDVPVAPKGMVLPRDGTPLALCFRHGMVGYNYSIRASDL
jgi:hypothetical protein